jgi:hypothetical protein
MKTQWLILTVAAVLLSPPSDARARGTSGGFGFNAPSIAGAPTGEVELAGGGSFDAATGFVQLGGGFRCLADIQQGPLAGCHAGEGVRWEALELLPSTNFKCSGSAAEAPKSVLTDGDTVVFRVAFFRQGDGATPSFTALMFVSSNDEARDQPGNQNVWIQGVGCGDAMVNFR